MPEWGNGQMDIERLAEILDAYGADPKRWPEAERPAAEALLASSQDAARLHADALALDTLLDLSRAPEPSPELMASILAGAEKRGLGAWLADFWPFGPAWQPASAFALAVILGIAAGAGVPDLVLPEAADSAIADVESLAFGPAIDLENGL